MGKDRYKKESLAQTRKRISGVANAYVLENWGRSLKLISAEKSGANREIWNVIFTDEEGWSCEGSYHLSVHQETDEVTVFDSLQSELRTQI